MLLTSFAMTVVVFAIESKLVKRHIPNSVTPQKLEQVYDLSGWVNQLHLQQCVFVSSGENYFSIFVESRPLPQQDDQKTEEYFIGLCDIGTLTKWRLCNVPLERKRLSDCTFVEDGRSSARVHRRLCELSDLALYADLCDCTGSIRGKKLQSVIGFPTCYLSKLPESLCDHNNVCGLNVCSSNYVENKVYSVTCNPNCFAKKPFCELPTWQTSIPSEVTSFWTDWSEPTCVNSDCRSQFTEARCVNRETGEGDVDCLGPGTSCCTSDLDNCKCHVFIEDKALKVIRTVTIQAQIDEDEIPINDIIRNLPARSKHSRHPVQLATFAPHFQLASSWFPNKKFRVIEKSIDDDAEFDDDTLKLPPLEVFSHDKGSLKRKKLIANNEEHEDDTSRKVSSLSYKRSYRRNKKSTLDDEEYEDDDQGDIDEDDDVVIDEENIKAPITQEYDREDEEENTKNFNSQVKHVNDTILDDVARNESVVNCGHKIICFGATKILCFDLISLILLFEYF